MKKKFIFYCLVSLIGLSFFCRCNKDKPNKYVNAINSNQEVQQKIDDKLGDKVYREFTVGGETVSRWVVCNGITEYDNNGNYIYSQNSYGDEKWYEYDKNGNCIHKKHSNGRNNINLKKRVGRINIDVFIKCFKC